jgi:predicted patatin/cPLA2 family phospholipase
MIPIAIVLPGGGAKCVRQAGFLKALDEDGRFNVRVMSGSGMGSINMAGYAGYRSRMLESLWLRLIKNNSSIFRPWKRMGKFFGSVYGLIFKGAMYDSSPLASIIENELSPEVISQSNIKTFISVSNLTTGELEHISGEENTYQTKQLLLASASYPAAFPAIEINRHGEEHGHLYADGSIRETVPLGIIKQWLKSSGAIVEYIFVVMSSDFYPVKKAKFGKFGLLSRTFEMMIERFNENNPDEEYEVKYNFPDPHKVPDSLDFKVGRESGFYEGYESGKRFLQKI